MKKGPLSISNICKKAGFITILALTLLMGAASVHASTGIGSGTDMCAGYTDLFKNVVQPGSLGTSSTEVLIFDECVKETAPGVITLFWRTNVPTVSRVVYGIESVQQIGLPLPFEGYQKGTPIVRAPVSTVHSISVHNVPTSVLQFYRPVSKSGTKIGFGKEFAFRSGTMGSVPGTPAPIVIPNSGCSYLRDYLHIGSQNDPSEVRKLQEFLNSNQGENLSVTGVFGEETLKAVTRFQKKYEGDILSPWGYTEGTGYVYLLTKKKINEIRCGGMISLTSAELQEVGDFNYKQYLRLQAQGAGVTSNNTITPPSKPAPVVKPIIATTTKPISTATTSIFNTGVKDIKPTISPVTTTLEDFARKSTTSFASLVFSLPNNANDLIRCALNFVYILIIVYIVSNILAETKDLAVTRRSIRLKKLVLYAIGSLLAIPLVIWRGMHCLTLPLLTLAVVLVVAAIVYATTHRENKIDFTGLPKNPDQN